MAAVSAQALNALNAAVQRMNADVALSGPCTGEIQHLIITVRQIQIQAQRTQQTDAFRVAANESAASCNHRQITQVV